MQIVAVITPGDTNGSGDSNNTAPDLALIGVPVAAPFPEAPASPAPAPAVLPPTPLGVLAPSSTSMSPAPSSTTPSANPFMPPPASVANSTVPLASTPAPAQAAGVVIQVWHLSLLVCSNPLACCSLPWNACGNKICDVCWYCAAANCCEWAKDAHGAVQSASGHASH